MSELKYLQRLLFLLAMAFSLSFACVACGDDEDDEPIEEPKEEAGGLVGTWWCDHHYGQATDTYTFNADGTYAWICQGYDSEQGNYAYNYTLYTLTLSTTGRTRLYTIVTLEEAYFVMLDQDGGTYTYKKAGTGNGGNNNEGEEPGKPTTGVINGHEWVDLGLPSGLKWAACNVGASSPERYGDYFAWGETRTKSSYVHDNSTTNYLSTSELQSRGIIGSDGNLTAAYDAATANWGSKWRMPTRDEIEELIDNCTWTWTTQNGVNGRKVTGLNGNSIFLPAAGYRYGTGLDRAGSYGYYWSASPSSNSYYACSLYFNSDNYGWDYGIRDDGQSVRPVSDELLSDSEK